MHHTYYLGDKSHHKLLKRSTEMQARPSAQAARLQLRQHQAQIDTKELENLDGGESNRQSYKTRNSNKKFFSRF
jgi:hypothetical protein